MSILTIIVILMTTVSTSLTCREQTSNKTRTGGLRYDYSRGRYTNYDTVISNSTIVCSNIYSISQIFYEYQEHYYEQFLKITKSNITSLQPNELSQFETITKLFLSGIHIKKIVPGTFNGLSRLRELYLDNNKFKEVSKGIFNSLQKLQILDLSNNQIEIVEQLAFTGVSNLQKLLLQNNKLSKIDSDTFGKLNHLTFLNLSGNPLQQLPYNDFVNLDTLVLSNTDLTHFGDMSEVNVTMKLLDLSSSKLTSVDFALFPQVDNLDLTDNKIDRVDNCLKLQARSVSLKGNNIKLIGQGFKGMSRISLANNGLEKIDNGLFNNLSKLLLLDLSFNNITELQVNIFSNLTSIQILQLEGNQVTKIDPALFRNLTTLRYLNVSYNQIEDLQYGTFNSLISLQILDISHNKLLNLHPYLFYSLSNLQKLYFGYNQISSFDVKNLSTHLPSMAFISLDGNPWKCQELVAMKHFLKTIKINIDDGDDYNVENFQGIACQNDKIDIQPTSNINVKEMTSDIENMINNSIGHFLNEDFMNSNFVKFFNNESNYHQNRIMNEPKTSEYSENNNSSVTSGVMTLSIILQIIMCCLLLVIILFMFSFKKKQKLSHGIDRLSQVELC